MNKLNSPNIAVSDFLNPVCAGCIECASKRPPITCVAEDDVDEFMQKVSGDAR